MSDAAIVVTTAIICLTVVVLAILYIAQKDM
jgi:hypothetical protein